MREQFIPNVDENLNRPYNVTLTEGQISTILWTMEGYINGSDDYDEDSEYGKDVNRIFGVLENAVDSYYDSQINDTQYSERVDRLVDSMVQS